MITRSIAAFRSFFGPVLRDRRGAAAVFLAVALIPMMGAVGLAVDSSIGYLLKSRMGKALDTAGLAAGRVALDANAEEVAQQYFDANFGKSTPRSPSTDVDFELDDTYRFVTLSTRATTPTLFMRVFGHDTMTVSARSVIQRETTGMELALVMDNTGSMWDSDTKTNIAGTPFEAMRDAALDLVDIIYGDEDELDNVWVSLVPYVATVNIGPSRTGWLATSDRVPTKPGRSFGRRSDGDRRRLEGLRDGPRLSVGHRRLDAVGAAVHLVPLSEEPRATTTGRRSTTTTPAATRRERARTSAAARPITPLTASKATVKAGINAMRPWRRGGTAGNLGLAWGWRTLSPNWRGLWGDADLPLDYGTDFMEKVVVILTDGNNEFYDLHRLRRRGDDPETTVGLHRLRPRQRARSRRPEQDDDRRRRHRSSTPACSRPARR